jgi:ribosomal protein S18 acetylase RimI-like enzyme
VVDARPLTGRAYLDAVTRLLQEARLADPTGGVWEAADLHWWWRSDQHASAHDQAVWCDGDVPLAAVGFTRWGDEWGADVLGRPDVTATLADDLWGFVAERHRDEPVEMVLREDDEVGLAHARALGFVVQETPLRTAWMVAGDRPALSDPPEGFTLTSYDGGRHWLAARNGADIASRLAETGLYRPDLDLALTRGGEAAAYALFWADHVTGVGLVEPMRVEEAYAGRGLARTLLAAGLDRLAAAGCTRFKVSFDPTNPAAAGLYLRAGFRPVSRAVLLRRAAGS